MNRRFLITLAVAAAVATAAYLLYPPPPHDAVPPRDLGGQARWLMEHPADWLTAGRIAEGALDSPVEKRFELWRASNKLAARLSPHRPTWQYALVRGGLFHWYELGEADRKKVLEAAEPLLRDEATFRDLYKPLWELTGDFTYLRRANPGTEEALFLLRDLAATNGLFADYRQLRTELRQRRLARFEASRATMSPASIIHALPSSFDKADEPLLRRALEELQRRPLDSSPGRADVLDKLIDFALRHDVGPLDGLEVVAREKDAASDPMRARLALRLGHLEKARDIEIASATIAPLPWIDYRIERAEAEAKRGDVAAARVQLTRAAAAGLTPELIDATARITGSPEASLQLHHYSQPQAWSGLCGTDLCQSGRTWAYGDPRLISALKLRVAAVQSDEVPPYVEVFIDDALVAEGEVARDGEFMAILSPGLHRVEVRLANPLTRNRIQRRVKLSS